MDLLEEIRMTTTIRNKAYQHKTACYHSTRVKNKVFKLGDLMLRKLEATNNIESKGKLVLKWDGPFKITRIVKANTYHLQDTKGKSLPHA